MTDLTTLHADRRAVIEHPLADVLAAGFLGGRARDGVPRANGWPTSCARNPWD